MATHSSVLAWRIPGTGSLVGCRLWARTELDSTEVTFKSRDITLPTKVRIVKAMVFPVVMYGYES